MKGHTALPDCENFRRVGKVVSGLVKNDITKAPPKHHSKNAVEQHIIEISWGELRPSCGLRSQTDSSQRQNTNKGQEIHQTVPMDRDRPQRERDRIKLRVGPYGGCHTAQ